ncbi:lymphocyte-specific protein 1 isoform X2 [Hyla sarda]|uniref:lymphocyte-specific protein 1 isoform X2 n=1 Tax=Hyla sarda TaxID=327740 RepID=UPI0024C44CB8|nr:lymphocyte-specific protein 1 isoform X2 [Hyla sarda]
MSTSLLRRDSKKNLQNLLKLTTQWSVEDEEEAARERRRRERQQHYPGSEGQSPEDVNDEASPSDGHMGLKPSGAWETEEDEGFSDWSQKLEQMKLKGAVQATEEREESRQEEQSRVVENTEKDEDQQPKAEEEEDEGTSRYEAAEVNYEGQISNYEHSSHEDVASNQWETRESNDNEEENETPNPYLSEDAPSFELERGREEEKFEPYNDQRESHNESWRSEEVKSQAVSSDGEDNEANITVTERAEVLSRSIQKSNSIKRSEPPLPISKIDDRLEQYTHAIETSSKTGRLARTPSLELLSPTDAVANKKNMWESGEVTTASKSSPCKDTEGINIGVSEMINQWGKGKSEPDHTTSPKVSEVKPGEVLSKKSLWEHNAKSEQSNKSMTAKYKFVPTGHGKYEKVRVEEP